MSSFLILVFLGWAGIPFQMAGRVCRSLLRRQQPPLREKSVPHHPGSADLPGGQAEGSLQGLLLWCGPPCRCCLRSSSVVVRGLHQNTSKYSESRLSFNVYYFPGSPYHSSSPPYLLHKVQLTSFPIDLWTTSLQDLEKLTEPLVCCSHGRRKLRGRRSSSQTLTIPVISHSLKTPSLVA